MNWCAKLGVHSILAYGGTGNPDLWTKMQTTSIKYYVFSYLFAYLLWPKQIVNTYYNATRVDYDGHQYLTIFQMRNHFALHVLCASIYSIGIRWLLLLNAIKWN